MAFETAADILLRYEQLRSARGTFESTWQEISNHMLGLRSFNERFAKGEQRMRHLYDTTSLSAGTLLSQSMHGILNNPAARWHELNTFPREAREHPDNWAWLLLAEETLDWIFRNAKFGFCAAASEYWLDKCFFGTGAMHVLDRPGIGIKFQSRPLGEVYIDEGGDDGVDTVLRRHFLTFRKFIQLYGTGVVAEIDEKVDKQPSEEAEILEIVHPRKDITRSNKLSKDPRPFRSAVVHCKSKTIVKEGGYHTMPWIVSRFLKESGELYGRSPGWTALSDQKTLTEMSRVIISHGQKLLAPPKLVADDGIITQMDFAADGFTVVRADYLESEVIKQLPVSDKTVLSERLFDTRKADLERHWYAHLLQLFDNGSMTATQTLEIEAKAARVLISIFARAGTEMGSPLLERTLDIAERGGLIPPRPRSMEGVELDPTYLSPMVRAQRESQGKSILNTYAAATQMAQLDPGVMDNLDSDKAIEVIARSEGYPMEAFVPKDVVEKVRQLRAEQEAQQQELEQQAQIVEMATKAGPAIASMQQGQTQAA